MENENVGDIDSQIGDQTENNQQFEKPEKPNANASKADHEKYKRDMLRYKDRVAELEEKVKSYEMEQAEQKGNLSKVIEKLKNENKEIKQKYAQDRYNYVYSKVQDSISLEAQKLGCKDPETFYRLIDQDDIKAVQVDERFNPDKKEIVDLVDKYSKKYEHLGFFGGKVNVIDKAPTNSVNNSKEEKSMDKMSKEELLAHAKKLGFKTIK